MASNGPLADRTALITGAARGIGRAVAIAYARAGVRAIAGLDAAARVSPTQPYDITTADDLAETGRLVEAAGARFLPITADIRDYAALQLHAARVNEAFGGIDILAAVAGIQSFKPLLDMQDADWGDQIDINLTGTANTIRAVAPFMIARGGRIVVTSSTQGQHGMRDGSAYSASKWGLFGLMKSAALEFAEHGITVNAVVPGLIDTPLTRHHARYAQAVKQSQGRVPDGPLEETVEAAQRKKIPLGIAFLPPDDMAGAYVFLASDAARLVTGTSIAVTGGDSANNLF